MLENKFPIFKSGKVLSIEMLNALRDYPKTYIELLYFRYSDGIIEGLNVGCEKNKLVAKKGIIKYKGEIHFLCQDCNIDLPEHNGNYVIKIIETNNKENTEDFNFKNCSIVLCEVSALNQGDLEIARFGYTGNNASVVCRYKKFEDLMTPSNTLDIRRVKYSSQDSNGTISPAILIIFANELLIRKNISSIDYAFAFQCLNNEIISRTLILKYIGLKCNENINALENEEIYDKLNKILSGRETKVNKSIESQAYEMEVL